MSPKSPVVAWRCRSQRSDLSLLAGGLLLLFVLGLVLVCIGMAGFDPVDLVRAESQGHSMRLFVVSRVPCTLTAVLVGSGIAVTGIAMQMSVRSRFVSPTTAGTTQFAVVGLLLAAPFTPGASVLVETLVVSACAIAGSAILLWSLRLLPRRRTFDDVTVLLIGLMLGGVVGAGTTFVAWRYGLLQSLGFRTVGDLSRVLAGHYELLWLVALIVLLLYLAIDRLTVASLGTETATGLGLNYHRTINLTIMTAAIMTTASVVVVGSLPLLGLVVPNIISRLVGDNLHRSLPVVAVGGAVLMLGYDAVGRVVHYPCEVLLSIVMGVVGAGVFTVPVLQGVEHG